MLSAQRCPGGAAFEDGPGGSACCHWNHYGTQCNHPAQGRTSSASGFGLASPAPSDHSPRSISRRLPAENDAAVGTEKIAELPPSRVDQHGATGKATERSAATRLRDVRAALVLVDDDSLHTAGELLW